MLLVKICLSLCFSSVLALPQSASSMLYVKHKVEKKGETCECIGGPNWEETIFKGKRKCKNLEIGEVLFVEEDAYNTGDKCAERNTSTSTSSSSPTSTSTSTSTLSSSPTSTSSLSSSPPSTSTLSSSPTSTSSLSSSPTSTSTSTSTSSSSPTSTSTSTSTSSSSPTSTLTAPAPLTCKSFEIKDGETCKTGCSDGKFVLYDKDLNPMECSDLNGVSFKIAIDGATNFEDMYLENASWSRSYRHTGNFNDAVVFNVRDGKRLYNGQTAITVQYVNYKTFTTHFIHTIKDRKDGSSPMVMSTLENGSLARLTIEGRNSVEDCINNGPEETLAYGYGGGDCEGRQNGGYNFKIVKNA